MKRTPPREQRRKEGLSPERLIDAAARLAVDPAATSRDEGLSAVASRWALLDAGAFPSVRSGARHLREHDDLGEFLAGIDLIVRGIEAEVAKERPPRRGGKRGG